MSPKLILINGFAGSGKTTLAEKYVEKFPLSLNIEGDKIIAMIGGWKEHYDEARTTIFPLTIALTRTYLELGHDVVIPYLLKNANEAEAFEHLAEGMGVKYYEIYLHAEKDEAIKRLMQRGTWGEEGLPPLGDDDLPDISQLFDEMESATNLRPHQIKLEVIHGEIEKTFEKFLEILNT